MYQDIMNLAVVNFKPEWGNKASNLSRMLGYAEAAAARGADMVVFPEMALTGYDDEPDKARPSKMQTLEAETVPGPASEAMAKLTSRLGICAIFGLPQRDDTDPTVVYNAVAICKPDGSIESYQKIHLPSAEPNWGTRGSKPMLLDTPFGPIGIGICYDAYKFPELIRYTKALGGRLFINSTACSFGAVIPGMVRDELEAHVMTNSIYIASSNLVGHDLTSDFFGGSSVMGPGSVRGKVEYFAGYPFGDERGQASGLYIATIDLSLAETNGFCKLFSTNPLTGAPDWRPDIYKAMCEDILNDPNWQKICH